MSQMRGTGLNEKVTIELTQGQLGHLINLVKTNLRREEKRYGRPQDVTRREVYFAAHPEKSDLAIHLIERERSLLAILNEAFHDEAAVAARRAAWKREP